MARASTTPPGVGERAMRSWANTQPNKHARRVFCRPAFPEILTTIGVKTTDAAENADTASPVETVEAPRRDMWRGRDVSAMPSPIIWANTVNVIGRTDGGSLSSRGVVVVVDATVVESAVGEYPWKGTVFCRVDEEVNGFSSGGADRITKAEASGNRARVCIPNRATKQALGMDTIISYYLQCISTYNYF
mmetsp:Transcript_31460/g.38239  ORF Transcript_31460/g.38239 Transcript_31460/m.38239 type:complete len:190 (-) Transcript_31460:118-687(-)